MAEERRGPEEGLGLLAILFGGIILFLLIASICLKTEPSQCPVGDVQCGAASPCGCCDRLSGASKCQCNTAPFTVWNADRGMCCQPKANEDDPDVCTGWRQGSQCTPPKTSCDASLPECAAVGGCCAGGYSWSDQQGCCAAAGGACQCPLGRECPQGNEKCPADLTYGSCCGSGYLWDSGRGCCWSSALGECQEVGGRHADGEPCDCPPGIPCPGNQCIYHSGQCVCSLDGPCDCPPGTSCSSGCVLNLATGQCVCTLDGPCPCPPGTSCSGGCVIDIVTGQCVCGGGGGNPVAPGQTGRNSCASSLAAYDLNSDCVVNKTDADKWMADYCASGDLETCSTPCQLGACTSYDFYNDFVIEKKDYECICGVCDCTGTLGWVCRLPSGCVPA